MAERFGQTAPTAGKRGLRRERGAADERRLKPAATTPAGDDAARYPETTRGDPALQDGRGDGFGGWCIRQ